MDIKALCTAAAVAVGAGQAEAAVIRAYKLDFTLTDAGETYDDFETVAQHNSWGPGELLSGKQ